MNRGIFVARVASKRVWQNKLRRKKILVLSPLGLLTINKVALSSFSERLNERCRYIVHGYWYIYMQMFQVFMQIVYPYPTNSIKLHQKVGTIIKHTQSEALFLTQFKLHVPENTYVQLCIRQVAVICCAYLLIHILTASAKHNHLQNIRLDLLLPLSDACTSFSAFTRRYNSNRQ